MGADLAPAHRRGRAGHAVELPAGHPDLEGGAGAAFGLHRGAQALPLTPHTAALLVQTFLDAGLPPGVLNLVQGDREVGETLVAHPDVAGISFTGSLPVGLAIQQQAAPRLARTQLELGGKNAVIVLADADLDAAADAIVHGAFGQAGQRCSATSRVMVDAAVREPLVQRLLAQATALRVGPAAAADTELGPVVNADRRDACLAAVHGQSPTAPPWPAAGTG